MHTQNVIQKKCSNLIQTQQIFLIYYIRLSFPNGVYQSGLIWQEKNDSSANRVICQDTWKEPFLLWGQPSETSFPYPINYTCPKPAEILQGTWYLWALISWMSPCHVWIFLPRLLSLLCCYFMSLLLFLIFVIFITFIPLQLWATHNWVRDVCPIYLLNT